MNRKYFEKDSTQLRIFLVICVVMIAAGFAWAYYGDADSVIPVLPATAEATQATPATD